MPMNSLARRPVVMMSITASPIRALSALRLKKLGLPAPDAVMIGDTPYD
jgi:hypothetical protein